ncbi:MAG TPA: hypothetical protein ENG66_07395 [Thermococcus sp.]|nr:hypothetical protein [Thermococcus sp.]
MGGKMNRDIFYCILPIIVLVLVLQYQIYSLKEDVSELEFDAVRKTDLEEICLKHGWVKRIWEENLIVRPLGDYIDRQGVNYSCHMVVEAVDVSGDRCVDFVIGKMGYVPSSADAELRLIMMDALNNNLEVKSDYERKRTDLLINNPTFCPAFVRIYCVYRNWECVESVLRWKK